MSARQIPDASPSVLKLRLFYLAATALVLVTGYLSRQWSAKGSFVHLYVGDAIWAAMIYAGFRFLKPQAPLKTALLAALVMTWLIEFSQFYQAPWINALRQTRLGGLILGFSFLRSDLVMYTLGIGTAWLVDWWVSNRNAGTAGISGQSGKPVGS